MSEKYKVFDPEYSYFITFTLVEWQKLFHIPLYAELDHVLEIIFESSQQITYR